jgi:hypothetical protein
MSQYNTPNNQLRLAISNPDLGFNARSYAPSVPKIVNVTLTGNWSLTMPNPNVQVLSANSAETQLRFTLDHGLSIEVLLSSALSIDDFEKINTIKIYPNPTKGIFNISTENSINSLEMFDLLGRKVFSKNKIDSSQKIEINTEELSNTVYLIKFNTEFGSITKRLIINK